jgi:hypothetical protein
MMAVQNPKTTNSQNNVLISRTVEELWALSSTTRNKRNFGRYFLKQQYQQEETFWSTLGICQKSDGGYQARCVAK